MSDYLTDEEQLDKLKKWWEENGLMLAGAVVLSVAGVIGWNWYGEREAAAIAGSSDLYVDYLQAEGAVQPGQPPVGVGAGGRGLRAGAELRCLVGAGGRGGVQCRRGRAHGQPVADRGEDGAVPGGRPAFRRGAPHRAQNLPAGARRKPGNQGPL